MGDTQVGHIEVGRVDPSEALFPGEACFVASAVVERLHVWIETRDDLDDGEALGDSVSSELLKLVRPVQPATKTHPPGIAEPEKGRAVAMLKMAAVSGNAQRPMAQ
jgi:hypothetical protein